MIFRPHNTDVVSDVHSRYFTRRPMLEINEFEEITQIKLSRELNGKPLYRVAAYLVDGLLIDTGCSYTSAELVSLLRDKKITQVINTHFHEVHVGTHSTGE